MKTRASIWTAGLLATFVGCDCSHTEEVTDAGADSAPQVGRDVGDAERDATSPDVGGMGNDVSGVVACSDDVIDSHEVGEWTVTVDHASGTWAAGPTDGDVVLRGVPGCETPAFRTMTGAPDVRQAFGNYRIDMFGDEATWSDAPLGVPTASADGDALVLSYGRDRAIVFRPRETADLEVVLRTDTDGGELGLACTEDEGFFGLGSQVTGMDLRARTYPLWTQEQGNSKPESGGTFPFGNIPEAAYAPMGVWHSTVGYSALLTHDGYSELDLCETDASRASLRSYLAMPGLVAVAGTPRERVRRVTDYVGRVRRDLPDWTFGFWLDSVTGPDRLAEVSGTLRREKIPSSAIWSEDWIGGASSTFGFRLSYDWDWDPEQYPDLPLLVDDLHARGFAFLAYFNPFVPEGTKTYPEAVANGYLVTNGAGEDYLFQDPAFRDAGLVDLTNPDALAWLAEYQRVAVVEIGADGWMADFAEWLPTDAVLFDGREGWGFHNAYPLAWQEQNSANLAAAKEQLGEPGNWLYFARSGWASANGGSAGIAPTMWGGDQNTTWGYDDGFPTIVPIGAHLGLSGVAVYGSDIAGYNSQITLPNTDKELWFRWAATGAFHPLMRTHHGGAECENWNFDRDQETLDHTRRWASVHTLLLPEFRRLLDEAAATGIPITRHPWLVEPDSKSLWAGDQFQWFLGDDILVAPVLAQGATSREVRLPASGWWPLFGDGAAEQAERIDDVPVGDIAVYVRPGRALTLLGDTVDSFYGATDPTVTDLADVADSWRVALYFDAGGTAITASDLPIAVGGSALDQWSTASVTFGGAPLGPCATPLMASCVDGDQVVLVGAIAGELVVGGAKVALDAQVPSTVRIGVGGSVFDELRQTTPYTPNPDAPTWCPSD